MVETLTYMQWAVIALSALCVGMSKTGVQGIMLMIVPLLAMAFGAKESTGIILPIIGIGALIGVSIVKRLPEKVFRRFIQVVTILSVVLMII